MPQCSTNPQYSGMHEHRVLVRREGGKGEQDVKNSDKEMMIVFTLNKTVRRLDLSSADIKVQTLYIKM